MVARIKHGRHQKREVAKCLRCDKDFKTWDKRNNRICPFCKRQNIKKQRNHDYMEMGFSFEMQAKEKIETTIAKEEKDLDIIEKEIPHEQI